MAQHFKVILENPTNGDIQVENLKLTEGDIKFMQAVNDCDFKSATKILINDIIDEYEQQFYRAMVIPVSKCKAIIESLNQTTTIK